MNAPEPKIDVMLDEATPAILQSLAVTSPRNIKRAVGTACVRAVQMHLRALGPNKQGWPTTGFYDGAARGTAWDESPEGIVLTIDNAARPGAMRQRYYGGSIDAKDKLLAIPARAEFYGHSPTEFTNLQFVPFPSGAMAFVIGKGGVGKVNFQTGREQNVKGAGVRSEAMVAFWLTDHVDQAADPDVLPSMEVLTETALNAVVELVTEGAQ